MADRGDWDMQACLFVDAEPDIPGRVGSEPSAHDGQFFWMMTE